MWVREVAAQCSWLWRQDFFGVQRACGMIEADFASSARGRFGGKDARPRERAMVRAPAKRRVCGVRLSMVAAKDTSASVCRVPPPCAANLRRPRTSVMSRWVYFGFPIRYLFLGRSYDNEPGAQG
jgi:hypothetical protein